VLLLIGLLLVPTGVAWAQSAPRIEAHVSADSVKIGERFTVTLVAEHAVGTTVAFPDSGSGSVLFGDLDVIRRGPVRGRPTAEGRQVDSVAYEVAAFALDSARVPVLPVRAIDGRDTTVDTTVVGTAPRVVPVVSVVPPDAKSLRTPAALASFPRPVWVWMALGLGVVALLGGVAYGWWRWRKDTVPTPPAEEEQDPYEAALAQLQHLERRNPNDRETCKAFYVDLTEGLRVYLARRMEVRALEYTTPEVVEALRRRPEVPETATQRLQTVLEQADLVKFADAQPRPEESQAVLKAARGVLDALEAAQRRAEAQVPSDDAPSPA